MDDLISRQAAIEPRCEACEAFNKTRLLIPQPQRKKGKWIDCTSKDHWKCSECGDRAPMYWDANRQEYDEWFSPYCPNCGAKMEDMAER